MQNQTIKDGFLQGISALNDCQSADDVADLLRTAGITGRRVDPWGCPVSRWLQSCAGTPDISVGTFYADMTLRQAGELRSFDRPLPRAARQFITALDSNLYPELLEPSGFDR
jgi:hypothetical protein